MRDIKELAKLDWWLCYDAADISDEEIKRLMKDEGLSREDAHEQVWNDPDLFEFEWNDLCRALTGIMEKIGDKSYLFGYWRCGLENFGWRHQSGYKYFKAQTGKELLRQVLPDTECTFYIYPTEDGFEIDNAHHDAPVGGEIYAIRPATEKEIEEDGYFN